MPELFHFNITPKEYEAFKQPGQGPPNLISTFVDDGNGNWPTGFTYTNADGLIEHRELVFDVGDTRTFIVDFNGVTGMENLANVSSWTAQCVDKRGPNQVIVAEGTVTVLTGNTTARVTFPGITAGTVQGTDGMQSRSKGHWMLDADFTSAEGLQHRTLFHGRWQAQGGRP